MNIDITRRDFLKATAALVVAFGWPLDLETDSQAATTLRNSGGPLPPNQIDSWLIVHNDNSVTVMTGKVELGTGVSTSLRQIVADELDFPFEKIRWIQGDTANTVDQAPTFGSQTIKRGGAQLRQATAQAKAAPLSRAGVPAEALTIANGVIAASNGAGKKLTFAEALSAVPAVIANAIFNALGGCAEVPFTRSGSKRPSLDRPEDSTDQKKARPPFGRPGRAIHCRDANGGRN